MATFPLSHFSDIDILLASKSPRRESLLRNMGLNFRTVHIEVEELYPTHLPAAEVAVFLSCLKAQAYVRDIEHHQLVITADTTVVFGDKVLGKPKNREEAKQMLQELSGKCHKVISGVSLRTKKGLHSFSDTTEVRFSTLQEEDINYYVETAIPLDKAGAYGIQEWIGMIGIEYIKGCFYNVMGFPTAAFYRFVKNNPLL